jgi:hypothetical protein
MIANQERLRAIIALLDNTLDALAVARKEVLWVTSLFDAVDQTARATLADEWVEQLHDAQMDVGSVVHELSSEVILAGFLPKEQP